MADTQHRFIFTEDWFSSNIPIWQQLFANIANKPNINILEIGSYQGMSAVWLLTNVITDPTSKLTCVDTFEGSVENTEQQRYRLQDIFINNVSPFANRVQAIRANSLEYMRSLPRQPTFDAIYIDGDHRAPGVLEDTILAFPLLKVGGIMIFDDYEWHIGNDPFQQPGPAIDAFLSVYRRKIHVLHRGYQISIQKTAD